jgi:tetratricopeptide (TPR) repeat protein
MPTTRPDLSADAQRQLAAGLFNQVWELLEQPDRSVSDDDLMVHAAHASRYHWGIVGGPKQWAIGEWQCARVYAVLGRFEPALHHAQRCLDLATVNNLEPFDIGAAHEALARAYLVGHDAAQAAEHKALAQELSDRITDPEDKAILDADLATLT